MQSWKVVVFLLCQATSLKCNEAPKCTGDVTGATPAACDELGADGCGNKCTSVEGGVYCQCKVSGSNCLAVGPICKKPDVSSMTCFSLSDCEGKGWKKTWTSGTATTFSEDLASMCCWAMSKILGRCPTPGFSRHRTAGSRPIPTSSSTRARSLKPSVHLMERSTRVSSSPTSPIMAEAASVGRAQAPGVVSASAARRPHPAGGSAPAREVPCQKPLVQKFSSNRLPGFSFPERAVSMIYY